MTIYRFAPKGNRKYLNRRNKFLRFRKIFRLKNGIDNNHSILKYFTSNEILFWKKLRPGLTRVIIGRRKTAWPARNGHVIVIVRRPVQPNLLP